MKFEIAAITILVWLVCGCTPHSHTTRRTYLTENDRSTVGNGVEIPRPESGSAWFLGDKNIRYCAVVGQGFGLTPEEALAAAEQAFVSWRIYLESPGRRDLLLDSNLHLNSQPLPACDGTEHLTFYFQGDKPLLPPPVSESGDLHLAHSLREEYDSATGWGRGRIWVNRPFSVNASFPNWKSSPFSLHIVLLHELGHVLGCGHVPRTIMDSALTPRLMKVAMNLLPHEHHNTHVAPNEVWTRDLLVVRNQFVLPRRATCLFPMKSDNNGNALANGPWGEYAVAGPLTCNLKTFAPFPQSFSMIFNPLKRDETPFVVEIEQMKFLYAMPEGEPIFKWAKREDDGMQTGQLISETSVYSAMGYNFHGLKVPLTVIRNSQEAHLQIFLQSDEADASVKVLFPSFRYLY